MDKCIRIIVSGKVQGVFFRASTRDQASTLGIAGFVRNLYDGRVEIVAQGKPEQLDNFVAWCAQGPPGADVTDCNIAEYTSPNAYRDFEVRY